jgi:serine/threonine-protein kinase PpkA
MIRADGSPALIDFGISKRVVVARYQEGLSYSMGSPHFMSPEQMRGEPLDERSDIYSFGALWYRIFTGQTPFPGRSFEEIRQAREDLVAPSMGDALKPYQPIVNKTLAGARDQRFSTAQELIDNIDYHFGTATGINRIPFLEERRNNRQRNAIGMHCHERRRSDLERIPNRALP